MDNNKFRKYLELQFCADFEVSQDRDPVLCPPFVSPVQAAMMQGAQHLADIFSVLMFGCKRKEFNGFHL